MNTDARNIAKTLCAIFAPFLLSIALGGLGNWFSPPRWFYVFLVALYLVCSFGLGIWCIATYPMTRISKIVFVILYVPFIIFSYLLGFIVLCNYGLACCDL
jgi:hypothetical protein